MTTERPDRGARALAELAAQDRALKAGTHEPAVDDFGNQYLARLPDAAELERLRLIEAAARAVVRWGDNDQRDGQGFIAALNTTLGGPFVEPELAYVERAELARLKRIEVVARAIGAHHVELPGHTSNDQCWQVLYDALRALEPEGSAQGSRTTDWRNDRIRAEGSARDGG